jgi:hypothetical protein
VALLATKEGDVLIPVTFAAALTLVRDVHSLRGMCGPERLREEISLAARLLGARVAGPDPQVYQLAVQLQVHAIGAFADHLTKVESRIQTAALAVARDRLAAAAHGGRRRSDPLPRVRSGGRHVVPVASRTQVDHRSARLRRPDRRAPRECAAVRRVEVELAAAYRCQFFAQLGTDLMGKVQSAELRRLERDERA